MKNLNEKMIAMIKEVITKYVYGNEEDKASFKKLTWGANLPNYISRKSGEVKFRSEEDSDNIATFLPVGIVDELVTAEAKARKALDEATIKAGALMGTEEFDKWQDAEKQYKEAKRNLMEDGTYNVSIENIPFGKDVALYREAAASLCPEYDDAQRWYWNVQAAGKRKFYKSVKADGSEVPGMEDLYTMPVFNDDHPFSDPTHYWEVMRQLLPSWVVSVLKREGISRVNPDRYRSFTNGTYDYRCCEAMNKGNEKGRATDGEEFSKKRYEILDMAIGGYLRGLGVDTSEFNGVSQAMLDEAKKLVDSGDASAYALFTKLYEIVGLFDINASDIKHICGYTDEQYENFCNMYAENIEINARQRRNKFIDKFVGEWYQLDMFTYIEKNDVFRTVKESMIANIAPYFHDRFEDQFEEDADGNPIFLPEGDESKVRPANLKDLFDVYGTIGNNGKADKNLRNKIDFIKASPKYLDYCEIAANAIQDNKWAMIKLAETSKFDIVIWDTQWSKFLIALRDRMMTEAGDLSQRFYENSKSRIVTEASDAIVSVAEIKAAYMVFKDAQEQIATVFGTYEPVKVC